MGKDVHLSTLFSFSSRAEVPLGVTFPCSGKDDEPISFYRTYHTVGVWHSDARYDSGFSPSARPKKQGVSQWIGIGTY